MGNIRFMYLMVLLIFASLSIVGAMSTPKLTLSNTLADSGQYETLTANVIGATAPYTVNFYNVTTGAVPLQILGYQQWLATNAYPAATYLQSCLAYSNGIYCIAGYNSVTGTTNAVYTIPIMGSGMLGSFTAANAYPLPVYYQSCVTYSNEIYCIGGEAAGAAITTVYAAPIFNSGALGSWSTSANAYPQNIFEQSCATYTNNIYCISGSNSGNGVADYQATIFNSGIVGAWTPANSYPKAASELSCAAYSNSIYCIGGSGPSSSVYYAPIFSSDALGSWAPTNSYPIVIEGQSCVTYTNSIYCVAGATTGGTEESSVYTAPILSPGVVGTWMGTTQYPTSQTGQSCTVSNANDIYCFGGDTSGTGYTAAVYYAPVSAQGISNTLNYTFRVSSPVQNNNVFYYNVLVTDSLLNSANSITNSFSANELLFGTEISPSSTENFDSGDSFTVNLPSIFGGTYPLSYNVIIYNSVTNAVIANRAGSSNTATFTTNSLWVTNSPVYANIIYTDFASTPAINTTTNSPPININAQLATPVLSITNTLLDSGQYETFNTIPSLGTGPYTVNFVNSTGSSVYQFGYHEWLSTANAYPVNVDEGSCLTYSNNIYCIAGNTNPSTDAVYYSPIFSSGVVGAWTSTNVFPESYTTQTCVTYANNIQCAAYYAPILSPGVVGTWVATNNYKINSASCATYSNNIYCIDGSNSFAGSTNAVYYAPIFNSGARGSWTAINSYPATEQGESCNIYSNDIYCVGGYNSISSSYSNTVYFSPVLSPGVIGSWTAENSYPANIVYEGCGIDTNWNILVCEGGENSAGFSLGTTKVYYAPIFSSGALGSWSAGSAYPLQSYYSACATYSNSIYCIGGSNQTVTTTNIVASAQISASGVANQLSYTFDVASTTTSNGFSYNAIITDSSFTPDAATSASQSIVVNEPLAVTISPGSNSLGLGISQFWTASVTAGQPPYTYNWMVYNSLGFVTNALYTSSTFISNVFSFDFLAEDTYYANVIVTDHATTPTSANTVNSVVLVGSSTTSTTTTSTSTVSSGGGGGSSGGGAGGGGSSLPTVMLINGCEILQNLTVPNEVSFTFDKYGFIIINNYIASNYASLIINNETYVLNVSKPVLLAGTSTNITLTSVSYLPIEHEVNFKVCSTVPISSTNSSSVITQNYTVNSSKPNTTTLKFNSTNTKIMIKTTGIANVTVSNIINTVPKTPSGFKVLDALSINVQTTTNAIINVTMNYPCGIPFQKVAPYKYYTNGTWLEISPYTVNTVGCTETFIVPKDPIVALFQNTSQPSTSTITSSTSTTTSTLITTITTTVPQNELTSTDKFLLLVLVIVVILGAIAWLLNHEHKTKSDKEKRREELKDIGKKKKNKGK